MTLVLAPRRTYEMEEDDDNDNNNNVVAGPGWTAKRLRQFYTIFT